MTSNNRCIIFNYEGYKATPWEFFYKEKLYSFMYSPVAGPTNHKIYSFIIYESIVLYRKSFRCTFRNDCKELVIWKDSKLIRYNYDE